MSSTLTHELNCILLLDYNFTLKYGINQLLLEGLTSKGSTASSVGVDILKDSH